MEEKKAAYLKSCNTADRHNIKVEYIESIAFFITGFRRKGQGPDSSNL